MIYDTETSPCKYIGSENIDTTDNQISLNFPRNYDGAVFQGNSGTDNFTFLQNTIHGSAPIAQLYSSTHLQNYVHSMVVVKFLICIINHL